MKFKSRQYLTLAASALAVAAGVWITGSQQNPWSLFLVWFMPVTVLEVLSERRGSYLAWACVVIVIAASVVGLVETLGSEHVATLGGGVVCAGLVAGTMASQGIVPYVPTPPA